MANKFQSRKDAPFGDDIWNKLDEILIAAAKSRLSARKILDIEGPYGFGLKNVLLQDKIIEEGSVSTASSAFLPVPLINTTFELNIRDIAAYEETGFSINCAEIAKAAISAAEAEDCLIFSGSKKLGVSGLLNAEGVQSVKLENWDAIGAAAKDIIIALNALDSAGFHGPYKLALAPELYNQLFRLYPQGYQIELQHIESIVGSKVIKAPGIKKGGVLLADGKQYASIVIGQDMVTGFIGPEDMSYKFNVSESIVPWIKVPSAVCVLDI